jgi:hypothetical protein
MGGLWSSHPSRYCCEGWGTRVVGVVEDRQLQIQKQILRCAQDDNFKVPMLCEVVDSDEAVVRRVGRGFGGESGA